MHDFEKEEQELEKSKPNYDQLNIADDLANQAILEGIKRAKNMKTRKKKNLSAKVFLVASILIIGIVSSIKISDAMADYIANVPGMEGIIKLIRQDKGLVAAVENNYLQKVEASDEYSGLKVTVDSIIHDERNLIVFFQYETINNNLDFALKEIILLTAERETLPYNPTFSSFEKDGDSLRVAKFPLDEKDELPEKLIASFEFRGVGEFIDFSENGKIFDRNHEVAFSIDKDKFAKKEVFQLNQTSTVAGQNITIKEVILYPSQADVHLVYDEKNSKRIFGFNDLELVDGAGRVWHSYAEKSLNLDNEDGTIIQLQSPYFSYPEELYLRFSSIRAIEKDELWVEIDPVHKKILKAPKDGKLKEVFMREDKLEIKLETDFNFLHNQIFMYAEDFEGNIIGDGKSFGAGGSPVDNYVTYSVPYPEDEKVEGPIRLKLLDYPATINRDINLKIR